MAQTDSTQVYPVFDSQLLKLKVPHAFQKSSLKLEVFADSSWQLYRGNEALNFQDAMKLLGHSDVVDDYTLHAQKESEYTKEFRSRRVFSIISTTLSATYLTVVWSKGIVYHIPAYAGVIIAAVRYFESRKIEVQALREQYYLQSLIRPSEVQRLVDDYNFNLYQYLSTTGIQFRGQ